MILTKDDFKPINLGVLIAENDGDEFIFQRPFHMDKARLAQDGCVLLINHKAQPVDDFEHALRVCNDFIATA